MAKQCTRCKQSLPIEQFVEDKNKRDGHASLCRPCNALRQKEFRKKNREHVLAYGKRWYNKHLERRRQHSRDNQARRAVRNAATPPPIPESKLCPRCNQTKPGVEFSASIHTSDGRMCHCKACMSEKRKVWRERNPEKAIAVDKQAWAKYRPKYSANYKKWVAANRMRRNLYRNEYHKERMASDPNYRIAHVIRTRVHLGMAGLRKSASAEKLLGCTFAECRKHLEAQWEPWMSWECFGEGEGTWQIDHIVPISSFNLADPEEQKLCFHHLNLRPMCSKANRDKWHKFDPAELEALRRKVLCLRESNSNHPKD